MSDEQTATSWREEALAGPVARWLTGPSGAALVAELVDVLGRGAGDLEVATLARRRVDDAGRAAAAHSAAASRLAARAAGQPGDWWTAAALEQASHPAVAAWRARRYAGRDLVVDLTAGCGGDASALAGVAPTLALERHAARVRLLAANLRGTADVVRADALAPPVGGGLAWADPARRAAGRRLRRLADLRPPVPALRDGAWSGLGIAVSPAVDLQDPVMATSDVEVEFLQVGARLVEATLWFRALRDRAPGRHATRSATLLPSGAHLRGMPGQPLEVGPPGAWLAVPAPALVRARLADAAAGERGLTRLSSDRALFWAAGPDPGDPWFAREEVVGVTAPRPRSVRALLDAEAPGVEVEVVLHGMDADVRSWHRTLRAPTGPRGLRVHLVRERGGATAIVSRHGRSSDTG